MMLAPAVPQQSTLSSTLAAAKRLVQLYEDARQRVETESQHQDALKARVREQYEHFHSVDIVGMLIKQKELEMQLQFEYASQALCRLEACQDVTELPRLVLQVQKHMPARLPRQTATKKQLDTIVSRKRETLLGSFHEQFESHLSDAATSTTGDDAADSAQGGQSIHMWSSFLGVSRVWLLAYSMVSLLPVVLGESASRVLDIYQQDILEEALLPMWGRFLFHLTAARDEASQEQLLWTFGYARSYVELLCDMCAQISQGGLLERLCPGAYREAGARHVVEKAVRFLRAHVAQIVLAHASGVDICGGCGSSGSSSSGGIMRVVEFSLELDHFLNQQCPGREPGEALTVTAVFCDAPALFRRWLEADFCKLRGLLEAVCFDAQSVYASAFSSAEPSGAGAEVEAKALTLARPPSRYFCYRGVYESLALFVLASKRYACLPAAAQAALSSAILEPLLAVALGLLMLRVRSCAVLHAIDSCEYLPLPFPPGSGSDMPDMPVELSRFVSTAAYLEEALAASSVRTLWTCPERFAGRVDEVRKWVPKHCTAREGGMIRREFEFSPFNLVVRVMPFPAAAAAERAAERTCQIVDVVAAEAVGLSADLCRKFSEG